MKYQVKPLPKDSRGARNGERNRQIEKEKAEDKVKFRAKNQLEDKKDKEKMHLEVIKATQVASELAETNANGVIGALSKLQGEISKLELNLPELLEGDKIASSISENSEKIESALANVVENIDKIKLEIPESKDIKPYVKSLTDAIKDSMSVLKSSISELNQSVIDIRLEQEPQPIEWTFDVKRGEDKYITQIIASAYYGEENGG